MPVCVFFSSGGRGGRSIAKHVEHVTHLRLRHFQLCAFPALFLPLPLDNRNQIYLGRRGRAGEGQAKTSSCRHEPVQQADRCSRTVCVVPRLLPVYRRSKGSSGWRCRYLENVRRPSYSTVNQSAENTTASTQKNPAGGGGSCLLFTGEECIF